MKNTRLFAIFFVLSVLAAVITVANPVLGAYSVTNTGLTDTQLRATAVPVSGTVTATVTGGTIVGTVAHDGVDSGAPVKVGLYAASTMPTAVAAADRTNAIGNLYGETRIALPQCTDASTRADVTTTTTTATAAVTAGVLYEVCAEGAPVFWRWAATATTSSGRYLPEGACRYELSVGTAIAAITRAGGGFLHAVSCVY